jgi:hypothetical protein
MNLPIDITHLSPEFGLIIELLVPAYLIRVGREVAADLRREIEAYGAGNLRQGVKIEELIERVRNEMHAERG